jgi:hypothetical protein
MESIQFVLREFITKMKFISKHFNYNIHFLNTVYVCVCVCVCEVESRVVNTFPQAFLEVLHHSLQNGVRWEKLLSLRP